MDCLDPQRVASEQAGGQGVVDMGLDRCGAIERLAKADQPRIGMDRTQRTLANSAVRSVSIAVIFTGGLPC